VKALAGEVSTVVIAVAVLLLGNRQRSTRRNGLAGRRPGNTTRTGVGAAEVPIAWH
jgi:hypothetical protein